MRWAPWSTYPQDPGASPAQRAVAGPSTGRAWAPETDLPRVGLVLGKPGACCGSPGCDSLRWSRQRPRWETPPLTEVLGQLGLILGARMPRGGYCLKSTNRIQSGEKKEENRRWASRGGQKKRETGQKERPVKHPKETKRNQESEPGQRGGRKRNAGEHRTR